MGRTSEALSSADPRKKLLIQPVCEWILFTTVRAGDATIVKVLLFR